MRGGFEKMTREATHASQGRRPVHAREVPLPLTREEIGSPLTNGNGFPYAEGWRLRYPVREVHMSKALTRLKADGPDLIHETTS